MLDTYHKLIHGVSEQSQSHPNLDNFLSNLTNFQKGFGFNLDPDRLRQFHKELAPLLYVISPFFGNQEKTFDPRVADNYTPDDSPDRFQAINRLGAVVNFDSLSGKDEPTVMIEIAEKFMTKHKLI